MTTHDTALVLVGHGSARHPDGALPVLALAEEIRHRGLFAEVTAVFMKQPPGVAQAEQMVSARIVYVVPVFAGQGYYTDELIPREMRLDGPMTCRDGRVFHYTPPAGTHADIPDLLVRRAETVAAGAGMDPAKAALLLIAHGSKRPGGAGATPRSIAAAVAAMNRFAEVGLVFLEQDPPARDWREVVTAHDVVALPLLVAQGTHASQDIPPLFAGVTDRRVALGTGLGGERELVDVVLDLVATAGV